MYRREHCWSVSAATRVWLVLIMVVCLASFVQAAWSHSRVITWGANSSEWNRVLGVDAVRMGCSGRPTECVGSAERLARAQRVDTVYLAIRFDAARSADDARTYSRMSLDRSVLHEVGFDDFVSQSQRQGMSFARVSSALLDFAEQLKSANPELRLGLTLYMDQISSTAFPLLDLDRQFRQRVDYIHLYPHYRREAESFSTAVAKVQRIFPNAAIIAGIYAYDRRDYLPCARGRSARCSNDEEIALFASSLHERWDMLQAGGIQSIEFYPGNFGSEEEWSGWGNPRSCQAGRRRECVANTQLMRQIVRQTLDGRPPARSSSDQGARPK